MTEAQIRVRFAPSPTGALHIGGARTAYFNWLFARQTGGKFVLRIDDTDKVRSTEASYQQILDSFRWLGIDWDEGPDVGGPYGPYRQSARQAVYEIALTRLLAEDKVYPCFCSQAQLTADRSNAQAAGQTPRYSGRCTHLTPQEQAERLGQGERPTYRLRSPQGGETVVHDLIRGEVVFSNDEIDDFIIWKADGTPTYHFASCVDDADMKITHVIRADEHLSNTPRHIVLFDALGVSAPAFAHVPMILAPDRSKLSKRHGATSVEEYRAQGILPLALVNYLLLLGFSPGDDKEIVTREEAVARFDLQRVAKHAAVYDIKKLEWLNGHYLGAMPLNDLWGEVWPLLEARGWVDGAEGRERLAWLTGILRAVRERSRNVPETAVAFAPYLHPVEGVEEKGARKHLTSPVVAGRLRAAADRLSTVQPFLPAVIEAAYRALIEEWGIKGGELIHPTRLALTGVSVGPGLFDVMTLLGREACLMRMQEMANLAEAGTFALAPETKSKARPETPVDNG